MSSFFAQPPAQSTSSAPSLFGQPQQQQQQQPSSLFGQPQQSTTSSLFGQPQQQPQQQQQPSTGLFGQPQQQQQQQQQPASTGAFGSWGQSSQLPATTGFGTLGQQQQPQQQQSTLGSGLFGNLGQSTTAQPSLFGASTNQPAQQPGFGQPAQQQQQQQQQGLLLARQTKFNDLPDNFKSTFEAIETHIQGRIHISNDLAQRSQKQRGADIMQPIRAVNREAVATASVLESDVTFATHLKARVDQANQDLVLATRILDGYKNHAQHGANLKNHASFPLEFFQREAQDLRERLQWCKSAMEQIERKLASSSKPAMQQAAISHAMQAQHSTFMALAGATAQVHAEVERLKVTYTALYRSKVGGAQDPFQDTR